MQLRSPYFDSGVLRHLGRTILLTANFNVILNVTIMSIIHYRHTGRMPSSTALCGLNSDVV